MKTNFYVDYNNICQLRPFIQLENVSVSTGEKNVLHDISLNIFPGTMHVLMGVNGSGKSSMAYTLMGHPHYKVTFGSIMCDEKDLFEVPHWQRAIQGIFLAFQSPVSIPGLSIYSLLKEAVRARDVDIFSLIDYTARIESAADQIGMSRTWLHRPLDTGFSGGEKKKLELLQLLVLQPKFVILDELDSGLDSDTQLLVARVLNTYREQYPSASFLVISHQKGFLDLLRPDYVHIMHAGTIVRSGDSSLIDSIHRGGYERI
ncbi:MAG TPA: Fe-S cluster assembly ATPase SufC [Candidatus Dependentiae bacterium]|nr:Fe-S cluster assembly ATPase SufC [Candidatus Dependentiae bacterium]